MTFFARCLKGFLRYQHLGKRLRGGGPVREPGVRVSSGAQELFGFASLIKDVSASQGNNDARLLIAAAGAGADLFVSGDKAVLKRESAGAMRIVSPRGAWLILFGPEAAA